jgi:hypothetical protein
MLPDEGALVPKNFGYAALMYVCVYIYIYIHTYILHIYIYIYNTVHLVGAINCVH